MFNVVYLALGNSVAIIIGQLLGAGKMKEARDTDTKLIAFAVASCMGIGAVLALLAPLFPMIYNTTDEVRGLAASFIRIIALFMPVGAFLNASYFTLRSGGKTMVTFLFDSVFTWVVVVPVAFLLAHGTGLGIVSVYFLVQATELIKVVIGYCMVRSNVWVVKMV